MGKHTILFLAANPSGTDARALDREARAIHVELERSRFRDHFEFITRWVVEPIDLLRELRKLKPTVVHFSHARIWNSTNNHQRDLALNRDVIFETDLENNGQRHGLFSKDPDGRSRPISPDALEEAFGAAGASVKLVVLNACYSQAQAEALLKHVSCIVGIAETFTDDAARHFAIGFYGGLGECESVTDAYKQGCAAINLEGLSSKERPQLHVYEGVDASRLILALPRTHSVQLDSSAMVSVGPQ